MNKRVESFSEEAAVRTYLRLMHELAIRVDLVADACHGRLNLSPPFALEYCYLQFRRICELVALGCLQLHGDLSSARSNAAKQEWNAEKIMRLLQKSHPHSFPQCAIRKTTNHGWQLTANSKPNALTFVEFKELYNQCGKVLHRGTIRSIEVEGPLGKQEYDKLIIWSRKLVDLLNEHIIARADGEAIYFISLRTTRGGPACSIFSGFSEGAAKVAIYNLEIHNGIAESGLLDGGDTAGQ
ncbi:MAG: hypothetical protein LC114_03215 [Bryobacterales bacterium]|nr:hypothetical protein [Bryobacterales bacterium]